MLNPDCFIPGLIQGSGLFSCVDTEMNKAHKYNNPNPNNQDCFILFLLSDTVYCGLRSHERDIYFSLAWSDNFARDISFPSTPS